MGRCRWTKGAARKNGVGQKSRGRGKQGAQMPKLQGTVVMYAIVSVVTVLWRWHGLKKYQQRTRLRRYRVGARLTRGYRETSCGVSELLPVTVIRNANLLRFLANNWEK
jgi:hypothetical protein